METMLIKPVFAQTVPIHSPYYQLYLYVLGGEYGARGHLPILKKGMLPSSSLPSENYGDMIGLVKATVCCGNLAVSLPSQWDEITTGKEGGDLFSKYWNKASQFYFPFRTS